MNDIANKSLEKAIELIASATDRWDYEEKMDPLASAVQQYPDEAIEMFYKYPEQQSHIAWFLSHVQSENVMNFFRKESGNKDEYIREYAINNLTGYDNKSDFIDLFVKGLSDRSTSVVMSSIDAMDGLRDERVVPLLKSIINNDLYSKKYLGIYEAALNQLENYK